MKIERIRDPIHGLIAFQIADERSIDASVWKLIQTSPFQRLRRINQLGISDFVFPSATHSRFAHSIGVFNNARRLVALIERELILKRTDGEFNLHRAKIAMFAALLHDIGHGPFSHAFEEARKSVAKDQGPGAARIAVVRNHEEYTAELIQCASCPIAQILAEANVDAADVANLIKADIPADIYHAVVSSAFDADRLDYLIRDRYMTGTGAGAIDLEWLLDNVRVAEIDISAPETLDADSIRRHSFCLNYKARDAAEDFLLARYRLYANVYLHKTTRGFEQLISAFFRLIARAVRSGCDVPGLSPGHPLASFFRDEEDPSLANYLALDDTVIWGAIHDIGLSGNGLLKEISTSLLERKRPFCLDIQNAFPESLEQQRSMKVRLDSKFKAQLGKTVFRDAATLTIYGEIGADDRRAQKRLMIQMSNKQIKEITDFRDATITSSSRDRVFERYYFLHESDYTFAVALAA